MVLKNYFLCVPHLAKLDQINKQYIYQGNQVLSLDRVSPSFTNSNLNI